MTRAVSAVSKATGQELVDHAIPGRRIGVVDDRGAILWGDLLMALFWREVLPSHPRAVALVEVKCSQALIDEIGFGMVFATTPDGPRVAHTPLQWTGDGAVHFHLAKLPRQCRRLMKRSFPAG